MNRIIHKITPAVPKAPKLMNVAAYARVSMEKETMLHSFSAQVSYYSEKIQKHPGWSYAGVYADKALTGTKSERPEFQRLLADCRAGKIDLVLTKSISRFARNTVTLLETVRELKALGIDVFFEEQNIECDAPQYSIFTQMIVCDKCGKYYRRKVFRTETAWNCSTYLTMGKAHCHAKQVPEDILMKNAAAALGLTQFDEAVFRNQIQGIRVPCFNHLVFVFKDGRREERIWQDKSRASSWTDEMRAQAAANARKRYAK